MRSRTYIVDINSKMYQVARYKQFDNNIDYKIELVEDGVAIDLDNHIVKAFFENKEGIVLQKDCTIEGNLVTTKLDNNILALPGKVIVEFTIYHNGQIVTTFTITLEVEKSINKNEAIQKEPVWDIIANLLEIDKTVKAKLEEVDNKLIETTEITNDNTQKIDNKIKDIQKQLDSKVAEKFIEVDDTLNNKFNDKSIEINLDIDNKFAEKSNEIDHKVDDKIFEIESAKENMVSNVSNKVKEADTKIADCESRMVSIEETFEDLVNGTGYVTKEVLDKSLETKANKDEVYTIEEVDQAIKNIEIDTTPLQKQIDENKTDILGLQNELKVSENTKYTTINGVKEFECKNGYIDNIKIEGETLVNLSSPSTFNITQPTSITYYVWNFSNPKLTLAKTLTIFNFTDKTVRLDVRDESGYLKAFVVNPNDNEVFVLGENQFVSNVNGASNSGWREQDKDMLKQSVAILEGNCRNKKISYFEGLKSVGQDNKIEVLTRTENIFNIDDVEKGYIDSKGNNAPREDRVRVRSHIMIEENTDYYFPATINIFQYDVFKNFIPNSHIPLQGGGVFRSLPNAKYIRIYAESFYPTYQIVKGVESKPFVTYKDDKKQILTTLRSTPNGVKDEIYEQGAKCYKVQRCEEFVYSGEDFEWFGSNADGTVQVNIKCPQANIPSDDIVSNIVLPKGAANVANQETIFTSTGGDGVVCVRLLNSKLSATDKEANKKYLLDNKFTCVFKKPTPIITELSNFNPRTFADKTTFLLSSGVVQAEAEFEVTNNLRTEIDVLKGKVSSLDDDLNNNTKSFDISFLNGWNYWGDYGFVNNVYDINNINISGLLTPGVLTRNTPIFTLPKDIRPSKKMTSIIRSNTGKMSLIFIEPNGIVKLDDMDIQTDAWYAMNINYMK